MAGACEGAMVGCLKRPLKKGEAFGGAAGEAGDSVGSNVIGEGDVVGNSTVGDGSLVSELFMDPAGVGCGLEVAPLF